MEHAGWQCPKCHNTQFDTSQMRAEGGALSAMFDVSTNRFTAVTCTRCTYTDLYRTSASGLGKVLDFFVT